ncbi:ADP-ribosylglycohydrolase family protein [Paenibacillus sp. MER 180]|uniref:ADP-ribosylglycohydrolase family protein n=1 Tax=Paenibacillus sp. MER 180 TaxID=2939570 RepID=UPI002040266A|nr:ADP-ribosylglycohydrolase family protein [Paenibacillus sp. MER 180]MCM3290306.1 ADP-ribosylglycohydrolase family protein [Paenibacillus sp. MER 180]
MCKGNMHMQAEEIQHNWAHGSWSELLQAEWKQMIEEGKETQGIAEALEDWIHHHSHDEEAAAKLYCDMSNRRIRSDFPFTEPSDLESIRELRPTNAPFRSEEELKRESALRDDEFWHDRFHGAWVGRAIGCALGKPLEVPPFVDGAGGIPGWKWIRTWLQDADAWPFRNYVPGHSRASSIEFRPGEKLRIFFPDSQLEQIRFMETDDDMRYAVLSQLLMERHGLKLKTEHVAAVWLERLSLKQVFTAECMTFVNLEQELAAVQDCKMSASSNKREVDWERVRMHLNPYREWIGAQIRADVYGYSAPGRPELAAELAWRDASLSHVKNGIYGSMFVAAMIAAAFYEPDPERIVRAGLAQIPDTSRLAADIAQAIEIGKTSKSEEEVAERIWNSFGHYSWVHTNNNAALVAASLIFSKGDFACGVTTSVLGGFDTDCNGATVGSILGASMGHQQLPAHFVQPLNDTLYADVEGFHPIDFTALAHRSVVLFRGIENALVGK